MIRQSNKFDIMFVGLNDGVHNFTFPINESFFELHDSLEISKCSLEVFVELTKSSTMLALNFSWNGEVTFPCDRCLDEVSLSINDSNQVFVKFGSEAKEESENVMVISQKDYKINVSQNIYEFVTLSLPSKRVHDEGKCNKEVIEKLNNMATAESPVSDPRWKALKKLNY